MYIYIYICYPYSYVQEVQHNIDKLKQIHIHAVGKKINNNRITHSTKIHTK